MIYATDLDRTLIFSDKCLNGLFCVGRSNMHVVDNIESNPSYIDAEVASRLTELNKNENVDIAVVTSRSLDEYRRVNIPGFKPKYEITSCGGTIFKDGMEDVMWSKYTSAMATLQHIDKVKETVESVGYVKSARIVDGKYVFAKLEDVEPEKISNSMYAIHRLYPKYHIERERNKLYVLPQCITKGEALEYIGRRQFIIASGDGRLDIPMFDLASIKVVPGHSELSSNDIGFHFKAESGIRGPLRTIGIVEELCK
jgi:hypothetical protein